MIRLALLALLVAAASAASFSLQNEVVSARGLCDCKGKLLSVSVDGCSPTDTACPAKVNDIKNVHLEWLPGYSSPRINVRIVAILKSGEEQERFNQQLSKELVAGVLAKLDLVVAVKPGDDLVVGLRLEIGAALSPPPLQLDICLAVKVVISL